MAGKTEKFWSLSLSILPWSIEQVSVPMESRIHLEMRLNSYSVDLKFSPFFVQSIQSGVAILHRSWDATEQNSGVFMCI